MRSVMRRLAAVVTTQLFLTMVVVAQPALTTSPLSEKTVDTLPIGALYWRMKNPRLLAAAQASVGRFSIAVDAAGKACMATLGRADGSTSGASMVAAVGTIPRVDAATDLLRINDASGPPGSVTPVQGHPGPEAFCVLTGAPTIRGTNGSSTIMAGDGALIHGAGLSLQVSSTGHADGTCW